MRSRKLTPLILIAGGILHGICPDLAHAGALYIYEMGNVTDTGYAGAGLAARAGDAGTVFSNPAGMTRFSEPTYLAGLTPLYIDASFDSDSDTTVSGPDKGVFEPFAGGSFAAIFPVGERLRLGISAQNFFGLVLDWDDEWVGRYETTRIALIAPQLQPTLSYKLTNWLSIGAGLGLTLGALSERARVNNVDPDPARFSLSEFRELRLDRCAQSALLPGRRRRCNRRAQRVERRVERRLERRDRRREERPVGDGKLKYDDTDFALQGNIGVMITLSETTRLGLRYLTETDLDFESDISLSNVGPGLDQLVSSVGNVDLGTKMPQSLTAAIFHQFNDKWAFLGSAGWEEWSEFSRIRVSVDAAGIDTVRDAGFDDTWHLGVGAEYQFNPKWTFTAGFSYDSAAASDSKRPIELPLAAMYRYALGFKYRKSERVALGAGLSFLWEGDTPVKPVGNALRGEVSGQYENLSITFLSLYVQW